MAEASRPHRARTERAAAAPLLVLGAASVVAIGWLLGWPIESVVWHAWNLAAAGLLFALGRRLGTATGWSRVFVASAALLSVATVLDGSGALRLFGGSGDRVSLFLANPDLLASMLLALGAAAIATSGKRVTAALTPVLVIAMTYTGSRTGLLALAMLFAAWLVTARPRVATRGMLVAVIVFIGALLVTTEPATPGQNLLRFSWNLTHGVWRHDAQGLAVTAIESGGRRADLTFRIVAEYDERSDYPDIALYQPIERSRPGIPYVASAEFRSAEPQRVVLSSNLTSTTCQIDGDWSRCVTPASVGNGRTYVQLQLRHLEGRAIDLEMRRPQVEIGRAATAYAGTDADPWTVYIPRRLDPRTWLRQWPDSTRVTIYEKAFELIRTAPATGHGLGAFAAAARADRAVAFSDETVVHAHSTPLQLGVEFGLLGILLWGGVFVVMAGSVIRASGHRGVALVVGVTTLAVLDATFFSSAVYPVVFVVVGVLSRVQPR